MTLSNLRPLAIRLFLIFFIVTMVGVDKVLEFADLGFEMVGFFLDFVQVGICRTSRV